MSTMKFELFIETLLHEMQQNYPEFSFVTNKVTKENDLELTGISIVKEGCSGACSVYAEDLYKGYMHGVEISSIASAIMKDVFKSNIYSMNFEEMFSRDEIIAHTTFRMANRRANQSRLKNVPIKEIPGITDIVIYPVFEVSVGGRQGTVLVTNSLLEANQISVAEIHSAAEANTERRMAIVPLKERLRQIASGIELPGFEDLESFDSPFLVSYDKEAKENEASILGAPKVLASLKGSYYVIPSSIHELMFLPKNCETSDEELKNLIRAVNASVLDPTEVLSNHLYEWDGSRFVTYESLNKAAM